MFEMGELVSFVVSMGPQAVTAVCRRWAGGAEGVMATVVWAGGATLLRMEALQGLRSGGSTPANAVGAKPCTALSALALVLLSVGAPTVT